MERPIFKPIGTPVEELDTPVLVVDLDTLDANINTVHSFFSHHDAKLRPHMGAHRCPAIAHRQLAAGGTVGGVSVTTLGEAELFAQNGFTDILVASQVVTPRKIRRLCALARDTKLTVAVDSDRNVSDLSEAARAVSVTLNVVVDIHTGLDRSGVEPGRPALALARRVAKAEALHFAGLMTYEGPILCDDADQMASESRKWIQQVLDTREMVEKAGIPVETVSVGGTHNYEVAGAMSGVTEVPAGAYALMDDRYAGHRDGLVPAARVMSTVISRPDPQTVITDTGQKAIGTDIGLPVAQDLAQRHEITTVASLSAEHCRILLDEGVDSPVDLDDKVWLTPRDIGVCVNLYDYIHAVRNGILEAVWNVSARGRYA